MNRQNVSKVCTYIKSVLIVQTLFFSVACPTSDATATCETLSGAADNLLPRDPFVLYDRVFSENYKTANIFLIPELERSAALLSRWVDEKLSVVLGEPDFADLDGKFSKEILTTRLKRLLADLDFAREAKNLSYLDFFHLFQDALSADNRARLGHNSFRQEGAYTQDEYRLQSGIMLLPYFSDSLLSPEVIVRFMDANIFLIQLPSPTAKLSVHGVSLSPERIADHDLGHAAIESKNIESSLKTPGEHGQQRHSKSLEYWGRVEKLTTEKRNIVSEILFEMTHEHFLVPGVIDFGSLLFQRWYLERLLKNPDMFRKVLKTFALNKTKSSETDPGNIVAAQSWIDANPAYIDGLIWLRDNINP